MKKLLLITTIFAIATFSGIAAFAARPLTTDDSGTVDRGVWEIEGSLDSSTVGGTTTNSIIGAGKYGLLKDVDLGIEGVYQSAAIGLQLKAKYRFNEEQGTTPSFGVAGGLDFPAGGGASELSITGILTDTLDTFTYHVNLGITTGGTNSTNYSAAIDVPLKKDVNVVGELVGSNQNTASMLSALIGGQWQIKKNLTLDGGITIGLNNNSPSGFTIGLTTLI